jgi:hypothetical protein
VNLDIEEVSIAAIYLQFSDLRKSFYMILIDWVPMHNSYPKSCALSVGSGSRLVKLSTRDSLDDAPVGFRLLRFVFSSALA